MSYTKKNNTEQVPETHDKLLTVAEVARRLRVDDTTVRRWIKNGVLDAIVLPHVRTRLAYRIRQSTLDDLFTPAEKRAAS